MTDTLQKKPFGWQQVCGYLILVLLLCAAGYLLFANLGEMAIADYDEARHGVSAYEMIRNDDYLVNTYGDEPDYWNLKPPVSFWGVALGYRLFGYNAFGLRFISALSSMISMVLVTVLCVARFGLWPAVMALCAYVCNRGMYAPHFSRFGDADGVYQLFFTIAMLCMLMSRKNFAWFYGSALAFALAFLTKATHALNIVLICLVYVICTGKLKQLKPLRILGLLVCGAGPVGIWAAMRYARDGSAFFEGMFMTDVAGRVGSTAHVNDITPFQLYLEAFYDRPALVVAAILCVLCAVICLLLKVKLSPDCKDALIGTLIWFVTPIAFYTLMNVEFVWYVYSGFAALSVLTGIMVHAVLQAEKWKALRTAMLVAAFAVMCLFGWQEVERISNITMSDTYQIVMQENLDRDMDEGAHMYIQYNAEVAEVWNVTEWMQADRLTALMYGDVVCMDGGVEAFLADEEYAILLIGQSGNQELINQLYETCYFRTDEGYVYVVDK